MLAALPQSLMHDNLLLVGRVYLVKSLQNNPQTWILSRMTRGWERSDLGHEEFSQPGRKAPEVGSWSLDRDMGWNYCIGV